MLPCLVLAGRDPLQKVAKEFSRKLLVLKQPRVGLLGFPYHDGRTSSGSSIISERLTTYMAEAGQFRVIERSLLKKILEEQHLSESGVSDPATAKKIGKVLGVDVIVTGTLNDRDDDKTEVNARALKADTGEVLAASYVVIERTWPDRPRSNRAPAKVSHEPESEPVVEKNEAIKIGIPGGRGGGRGSR